MEPLALLVNYLLGLAVNITYGAADRATPTALDAQLQKFLAEWEKERKAGPLPQSVSSLRDQIKLITVEVARHRAQQGLSDQERPLFTLLNDPTFQQQMADWLICGDIREGQSIKTDLKQRMREALGKGKATPPQIERFQNEYFDTAARFLFSNPLLAQWRHALTLEHLQGVVEELRELARQAAGQYSEEDRKKALDRYCDLALNTWDIIDLSNLPEGDIHIATQRIMLRQLYVPLRLDIERFRDIETQEEALAEMEQRREERRLSEAGRHLLDGNGPAIDRSTVIRREPVGRRLNESGRVVVLGDPGGGKTTMLRWLATAYLLRYRQDPTYRELPDIATLPDRNLIPVLIRCRDLGEADLCRSFDDFLGQHLLKTELLPEEAKIIKTVVMGRIAEGTALILVDGLDEITNPRVRIQFCQELERTSARYPKAPIVVTSRLVGYREMPYRMRSGFEHGSISDLDNADKEYFAVHWVKATEQHLPKAEQKKRIQELLDALHSSDRIARLTGNPMLLTTLALVKRKVGKLPSRRVDLYREAVAVLLNWNPAIYQQIDEREAIPQLEYIAYEMCARGVQRLPENDILELLDRVRAEYKNIRPILARSSEEFLSLLEARSSILIKASGLDGEDDDKGPVYEFRHLTLQEYLAARALVDGRYPDRDKYKTLAEQVAPLAGKVGIDSIEQNEPDVTESWRETLRLCVACCPDDDVDDVLLAILFPLEGENNTIRARAALASCCLADEPNVSEESAHSILDSLVQCVTDGLLGSEGIIRAAAMELAKSEWAEPLIQQLAHEFLSGQPFEPDAGSLCGNMEAAKIPSGAEERIHWLSMHVSRLKEGGHLASVASALTIMSLAYTSRPNMALFQGINVEGKLIPALFAMMTENTRMATAAAWALCWLSGGFRFHEKGLWQPTEADLHLLAVAMGTHASAPDGQRFLIHIIARTGNRRMITPLLIQHINNGDEGVRQSALEGLAQTLENSDDKKLLLSLTHPSAQFWYDPSNPIDKRQILRAAQRTKLPAEEVKRRYQKLAEEFGLRLNRD